MGKADAEQIAAEERGREDAVHAVEERVMSGESRVVLRKTRECQKFVPDVRENLLRNNCRGVGYWIRHTSNMAS